MAWTKTVDTNGNLLLYESVTLAASATYAYSSDFAEHVQGLDNAGHRYVSVFCAASAVSGTNVDVSVMGSLDGGTTKFEALDAVVADVTNAAKTKGAAVDLAPYKNASKLYIGLLCDTNESANTMGVYIYIPKV